MSAHKLWLVYLCFQKYNSTVVGVLSENKSWDIERANTRVEQRTRPSPVHVFEHLWLPWLRAKRTLFPYSSRFPTSFSFSSSSLNHPLSMHSVHFLHSLELDKSGIVDIWDPSITTLNGGIHRCSLWSTGTQKSGSSSWPITHPSTMACDISSYSWVEQKKKKKAYKL